MGIKNIAKIMVTVSILFAGISSVQAQEYALGCVDCGIKEAMPGIGQSIQEINKLAEAVRFVQSSLVLEGAVSEMADSQGAVKSEDSSLGVAFSNVELTLNGKTQILHDLKPSHVMMVSPCRAWMTAHGIEDLRLGATVYAGREPNGKFKFALLAVPVAKMEKIDGIDFDIVEVEFIKLNAKLSDLDRMAQLIAANGVEAKSLPRFCPGSDSKVTWENVLDREGFNEAAGSPLETIGYRSKTGIFDAVEKQTCLLRSPDHANGFYYHDCKMIKGASGQPIRTTVAGKKITVGMHLGHKGSTAIDKSNYNAAHSFEALNLKHFVEDRRKVIEEDLRRLDQFRRKQANPVEPGTQRVQLIPKRSNT